MVRNAVVYMISRYNKIHSVSYEHFFWGKYGNINNAHDFKKVASQVKISFLLFRQIKGVRKILTLTINQI